MHNHVIIGQLDIAGLKHHIDAHRRIVGDAVNDIKRFDFQS